MYLNLNDNSIDMDYLFKMLYMNLMVTTNQKPIIQTQKIKKREAKPNTKESNQS